MTVFAIFTYTEFFKHKSAEGEKMNKKTTGIIAYITWIGWIVAFCAGDKEGAKFHLNQALVILIGQIIASAVNFIPKVDRKSTRLNSSHKTESRMPSSA